MKTVFVFKTFWPDTFGGIERVIDAQCRAHLAKGETCEVVTLSRDPKPEGFDFNGYRVFSAKCHLDVASTPLSVTALGLFRARMRDADVVHYHFPWPYADLAHLLIRPKARTIVTYQSDIVKQRRLLKLYAPLRDRFLASVDEIVATSPNYAATSSVLRKFADKVRIEPLTIDPASYPEPEVTERVRALGVVGRPFFVFVGVLRYYKGLHTLIEAAGEVRDADGSSIPIVIVGDGPEGPKLKAQAAALGVQNVVFAGSLDDGEKLALLDAATGFVFPSHERSEAFGIALVEAAMRGLPMISCEIGTGTSFVNKDGETGIVIPPEDPRALAEAMRTLAGDKALRARYKNRAKVRFDITFRH